MTAARKVVVDNKVVAENIALRSVLDFHYEVWRAPESLEDKRVCIFVAYAPDGYIPKSSVWFLRALRNERLAVICIVASRNSGPPYADTEIECDGLISRDNFGYDFASWALGLQIMPSIWKAKFVIFANDSMFGPISQSRLSVLLQRLEESTSDYIALTESWQVAHHYQSYLFALKSRALCNPQVKHFWTTLRCVEDRDQAILRYEVPMLERMTGLGLKTEALFPLGGRDLGKDINPTLDHWRELIDEGFPFIKVQTLRDDISGVDKRGWRSSTAIDPDLLPLMIERLGGRREQDRRASIARPHK